MVVKKSIFPLLLIPFVLIAQRGEEEFLLSVAQSNAGYSGPTIVTHVSGDTGGVDQNNIDITKVSGSVTDDWMIAIAANDLVNQNADSFSNAPTNWTTSRTGGSFASDSHWWIGYDKIDGTEGAGPYNIVSDAAVDHSFLNMLVRGADATTPISNFGVEYNSESGASHTVAGITTTQDNCLAVLLGNFDGSDGASFTATDGWTVIEHDNTANDGDGCEIVIAYKEMPTAGATGDCTITPATSDNFSGIIFQINP